ncbi:hypothetical protein MBANPS3_010624 [Mucor bainieri]
MLRSIAILALFIVTYCSALVNAASIHTNSNQWNRRPRQFRMQIFSRPDSKGAVQTIRATNGASSPCWNLASKRVGSYDLNDPLVKVTFYRSSDCKGAPSATFHQGPVSRNHVMIKAKSVSVTKVKAISLRDQQQTL